MNSLSISTIIQLSFLAVSFLLLAGCGSEEKKSIRSAEHSPSPSVDLPAPPAKAPEGFKWVPNEPYCDEFNGDKLDSQKWHDHYPGWEGRPPGKFVPSAISVKDGFLQISSSNMEEPQGENGEWTIACGAVQSKAQNAFYGYYECRMKASSVSTSSTFWLKNPRSNDRPFVSTELDIQECIGNAQKWASFGKSMIANTHVQLYPAKKEGDPELTNAEKKKLQGNQKHEHLIGGQVDDGFHVYGCWWVDTNTMKFYLDGEYVFTITPPQDIVKDPFSQKMFVNMVCEIYTWEVPPTPEELSDQTKNTTLYDYVRAYTLERIE